MTRTLFYHALCFLAGLAVTASLLWKAAADYPPLPTPTTPAGTPDLPTPGRPIARIVVSEEATPAGTPRERARARIEASLETIRHCSPQERAARWAIVLTQLKEEGEAGLAAMADFLATGEDLPLGPRLETAGISLPGPGTLRMAVLQQLANHRDLAVRELRREETLRSLKMAGNLADAYEYIRSLEYLDRGKYRDEAIATILRTAAEPHRKSNRDDFRIIGEVLTRFGAVELLPLAEARALAQPAERLHGYFGTLWKVPAETRHEVTERLLANHAVETHAHGAAVMPKLDYLHPAAREFAKAWFRSDQPATAKATALERIASDRAWTAGFAFPGDNWNAQRDPGLPGMRAQAEARLALLEEIAPSLSDPLLQQQLTVARTTLTRQIVGKQ